MRAAAVLLALLIAAVPRLARADGGEAGLVVQHGDGSTDTYCIAFEGSGIRGDDLLRRAGVPVEQFSGLVCSLGTRASEGCPGASSFDSCTCQCRGANCTYWAFFTMKHGAGWVYSALGLNAAVARDGDVQGWKWGRGGPSSAPAPAPTSFEAICGHAPRGGTAPAATAVSTLPAGATPAPVQPAATTTPTPPVEAPAAGAGGPTPAAGKNEPLPPASSAAVTAPSAGTSGDVPVPAPAARRPGDGGGSAAGVAVFAAVAAALVAATAAAVFWRRRHGA